MLKTIWTKIKRITHIIDRFVSSGAIYLINIYQRTLSPDHGLFKHPTCRFIPTCSEYSKEAINKYGILKGGFLSIKRVLRCNPLTPQGTIDPVK